MNEGKNHNKHLDNYGRPKHMFSIFDDTDMKVIRVQVKEYKWNKAFIDTQIVN